MSAPIKTAVMAMSTMMFVGGALPIAAYYLNDPVPPSMWLRAAPRRSRLSAGRRVSRSMLRAKPEQRSRMPVEKRPAADPSPICAWHANELFAAGRVWVCDRPRSSNHHTRGIFGRAQQRYLASPFIDGRDGGWRPRE